MEVPAEESAAPTRMFRVDELDKMSREEKDLAIKRLTLPVTAFRRMPPPRFRELSAAETQLVTAELKK